MDATLGQLDGARLRAIAVTDRPLLPHECAERARRTAALIELERLDHSGSGEAVLLWRDKHSEAWLNLWWQPRDTGYHDHDGSCVGVYVIAGRAWNEPLTVGTPPAAREYGPGEEFWFPGDGAHRMDHEAGAGGSSTGRSGWSAGAGDRRQRPAAGAARMRRTGPAGRSADRAGAARPQRLGRGGTALAR